MIRVDQQAKILLTAIKAWMAKTDEALIPVNFASVFVHYARNAFSDDKQWWKLCFIKPKFLRFEIKGRNLLSAEFIYHTDNDKVEFALNTINSALDKILEQEFNKRITPKSFIVGKKDLKNDEREDFRDVYWSQEHPGVLMSKRKVIFDEDDEATSMMKSISNFYESGIYNGGEKTPLEKIENFDFDQKVSIDIKKEMNQVYHLNSDTAWCNPNLTKIENFKF